MWLFWISFEKMYKFRQWIRLGNVVSFNVFFDLIYTWLIFELFCQIVPSTLKRQTRTESARPKSLPSSRPEAGRSAEDRAAYRRVPGGADSDKRTDVGPGAANLQFVSSSFSSWSVGLELGNKSRVSGSNYLSQKSFSLKGVFGGFKWHFLGYW